MATYGSPDVFVLVGGYSLAAYSGEFSDKVDALIDDKTPLGVSDLAFGYVGMRQAELKQAGWFDDTADAAHTALGGNEGVSRVLSWGVEGNVRGNTFAGYAGAMQIDYERILSVKGFTRSRATYHGTGQVDQGGIILQPFAAQTATYDTKATPVDNGALTSNGGAAYLQVGAYSGLTNVVVKIQHSVDASAWVDLVTFTTVTSGRQAQRVVVAGTVNRYLSITSTKTGTGSREEFVGFKRF